MEREENSEDGIVGATRRTRTGTVLGSVLDASSSDEVRSALERRRLFHDEHDRLARIAEDRGDPALARIAEGIGTILERLGDRTGSAEVEAKLGAIEELLRDFMSISEAKLEETLAFVAEVREEAERARDNAVEARELQVELVGDLQRLSGQLEEVEEAVRDGAWLNHNDPNAMAKSERRGWIDRFSSWVAREPVIAVIAVVAVAALVAYAAYKASVYAVERLRVALGLPKLMHQQGALHQRVIDIEAQWVHADQRQKVELQRERERNAEAQAGLWRALTEKASAVKVERVSSELLGRMRAFRDEVRQNMNAEARGYLEEQLPKLEGLLVDHVRSNPEAFRPRVKIRKVVEQHVAAPDAAMVERVLAPVAERTAAEVASQVAPWHAASAAVTELRDNSWAYRGQRGERGAKGERGARGERGTRGPKGEKGEKGAGLTLGPQPRPREPNLGQGQKNLKATLAKLRGEKS